jgi:hypothetical protein
MGCATKAACRTCKVVYDLGYGSYGSIQDRNARFPLAEHMGHDIVFWIDDDEWGREGGTLYAIGSYGSKGEPFIVGFDEYQKKEF